MIGFVCFYWILAPALYVSKPNYFVPRGKPLNIIFPSSTLMYGTASSFREFPRFDRFFCLADDRPRSISSIHAFDNTGKPYNVSRIINPDTTLDLRAYKVYSPLYLS
jgi:hypothetical protein